MTVTIQSFKLGPVENLAYLLFDEESRDATLIDAPMEPQPIAEFIQKMSLNLETVLITHAHFDHYYGLPYLRKMIPALKDVYLGRNDLELWRRGGGAKHFLGQVFEVEEPNHLLNGGEELQLGNLDFLTLKTPGHSAGSIIYYSPSLKCAFCGDVIFYHGIGRADLEGGVVAQLMRSIESQVFTLPEETILYPGHGPSTTVLEEKTNNPFFKEKSG